jgi:hypothetical protein
MDWLTIARSSLIGIGHLLFRNAFLLSLIVSFAQPIFATHAAPKRERAEAQPGWLGVEMRNLARKEIASAGLFKAEGR